MGISEAGWTAPVNDIIATLDKFKVRAKEQSEVLAAALEPEEKHRRGEMTAS